MPGPAPPILSALELNMLILLAEQCKGSATVNAAIAAEKVRYGRSREVTVWAVLKSLERKGLVSVVRGEQPKHGGPYTKIYNMTPLGRRALSVGRAILESVNQERKQDYDSSQRY